MSNTVREVVQRAQELANRIDTNWNDRTRAAVSRALKFWAAKIPWPALKAEEDFLTTGGKFLVFPERVGVILSVSDVANSRTLDPFGDWPQREPGIFLQDSPGTPFEWQDYGWTPFASVPATDTVLELQAGGSEAFAVRVTGLLRDTAASGTALELQEHTETLTMGGTNVTQTTTVWASLLGLEKDAGSTNWLKALNPLSSQVISFIPPGEVAVQHRRIQMLPVPSAGLNLRIAYYRRPEEIHSLDAALDNSVDLDFLAWRSAGDIHWTLKEMNAAQLAWTKAAEIMAANLSREKQSPTKRQTSPDFTYFGMETQVPGVDV